MTTNKTAADYNDLVCVIEPTSPFLTPINADTLWGLLAWACLWVYGGAALEAFLELQTDGSPAVLISDAFPLDYLPRPQRPLTATDLRGLLLSEGFVEGNADYLEGIAIAKEWTQTPYIARDDVFRLLAGTCTQVELFRTHLRGALPARYNREPEQPPVSSRPVRHNVIDRKRGGARRKNGLYTHQQTQFRDKHWCIYIRTSADADWLLPLIEAIACTGFGKRASTGMGQFRIVELRTLRSHEEFPVVLNPTGFMTLTSSYVPSPDESIQDCYYTLRLKRGKLGPAISTTSRGGFLKYPIAMFAAGSIFSVDSPGKRWFGRLLSQVHKEHDKIRHYGFAYPVAGQLF